MELMRCISEREGFKDIEKGKLYWVDLSSIYIDIDEDIYVEIYRKENNKQSFICRYNIDHFEIVYRYLNYGASLSIFLNTKVGFILDDIIRWCSKSSNHSMARNILSIIDKNNLFIDENKLKEYCIISIPFDIFKELNRLLDYNNYNYCIIPIEDYKSKYTIDDYNRIIDYNKNWNNRKEGH